MTDKEIEAIVNGTGIFPAFDEEHDRLINIYNSLEIVAVNRRKDLWRVIETMPSESISSPVTGIMTTLETCVKYVHETIKADSPLAYRRIEDSFDYAALRLRELENIMKAA